MLTRSTISTGGSTSRTGRTSIRSPHETSLKHLIAGIGMGMLAIAIGAAIGGGAWIYVAVATALLMAIQWPSAALGVYVLLVPFGSISVLGSGKSGTTLTWGVGLLVGVGLVVTGLLGRNFTRPSRDVQLWLTFLLWSIVTTAWALDTRTALTMLPTACALILLYAAAVCWRITAKQLGLLCRFVLAGGLAASLLIAYLYFSGVTYTSWVTTTRASLIVGGRSTNPDAMATNLLLPISLAVGWFVSTHQWRGKLAALAIFGVVGYAALATMSRAFLVSLAVMLFVYIWRVGLNRSIAGLFSTLLAVVVLMPTTFFSRVRHALATGGAGRLDIWSAGLAALKAHWLAGAGLANFPVAYQPYAGFAPVFRGYNRGAHNIYLETAVEFGIIGLALFLAALGWQLRAVTKTYSALGDDVPILLISLESACWAMLANGFFGGLLWEKSFWIPWLLLSMALTFIRDHPANALSLQHSWPPFGATSASTAADAPSEIPSAAW